MADNPDLGKAVSRAIFDPGKITPRRRDPDTFGAPSLEPLDLWQARAVLEAVRPFLGRHDPAVNCDCEPGDLMRKGVCEYRMLGDAVGDALNPPDGDEAEVAILIDAVNAAAEYIASAPCLCALEARYGVCPRCRALGQIAGERCQR